MTPPIETLQEECLAMLADKLRIAETDRDEHRVKADRAESLCKPIRRAIAELQKSAGKSTAPRPAKRCADKQEIMQLTRDTLNESGTISLIDLKKSVATDLRKRGRNLSMSAKLLAECLRTDEFEVTAAGEVALAAANQASLNAVVASPTGGEI